MALRAIGNETPGKHTFTGCFMQYIIHSEKGTKAFLDFLNFSGFFKLFLPTQQNKNFVAFAVSKETAGVFASERIRANGWQQP